jgi:hypothetical protein
VKLELFPEPDLEFGAGGRHIDIRYGILHHGPFDAAADLAPKRIRVALIGKPGDLAGVRSWLTACREPVPAKPTPKTHLFPAFPGFSPEGGFFSTLVLESTLERTLRPKEVEALASVSRGNGLVRDVVDLFVAELQYLREKDQAHVAVCAVPEEIAVLLDPTERVADPGDTNDFLNFHDLLKAKAMDVGLPVQLLLPTTYDAEYGRRARRRSRPNRQLQDPATRAWNVHAALYYKAGGLPWRIPRDSRQLTTCYVGVGFYRSLEGETLRTSMAQVFDELGDGIVVRGGPVEVRKEDRTPHLSEAAAGALLQEALRRYRDAHQTLPARVVIHKTSSHSDDELAGFRCAVEEARVSRCDLLSFSDHETPRLFRLGKYPPLRGTALMLEPETALFYLRGSVPFYETYPGLYIPQPLLVRFDDVEEGGPALLREILALSKMNWNQTQFDGYEPITLLAARRVGPILRHLREGDRVAPRYSYYM